jgi:hypothetical protein
MPRCVGGNNADDNLIVLSGDDHFFAHLLLAKIYGGKLKHAAHMMRNRVGSIRGRLARERYAWVARAHAVEAARNQKQYLTDPEARARMAAALRGKPKSPESIAKRVAKQKGTRFNFSPEERRKRAERLKVVTSRPGHYEMVKEKLRNKRVSPETRLKISKSLMGHPVSDEARRKMGLAFLGRKHSIETRVKTSASVKAALAARRMRMAATLDLFDGAR